MIVFGKRKGLLAFGRPLIGRNLSTRVNACIAGMSIALVIERRNAEGHWPWLGAIANLLNGGSRMIG
jgi:hypothetical protein